jgi:hypothetical protein
MGISPHKKSMRGATMHNPHAVNSADMSLLLCVEPKTYQCFAINMGTSQASPMSLDQKVEMQVTNKIKREEYKQNALLNRENKEAEWDYDNS